MLLKVYIASADSRISISFYYLVLKGYSVTFMLLDWSKQFQAYLDLWRENLVSITGRDVEYFLICFFFNHHSPLFKKQCLYSSIGNILHFLQHGPIAYPKLLYTMESDSGPCHLNKIQMSMKLLISWVQFFLIWSSMYWSKKLLCLIDQW